MKGKCVGTALRGVHRRRRELPLRTRPRGQWPVRPVDRMRLCNGEVGGVAAHANRMMTVEP